MAGPFIFNRFEPDNLPDWPCPACNSLTLQLVPGSMNKAHTAEAHKIHSSGYSPEEDECVFSCLLVCKKNGCLQPVAVSGTSDYQQQWIDHCGGDSDWFRKFLPLNFCPPLPLFSVNENYPKNLRVQLSEIAALLPGHPLAAANAVRTTLELTLDYLKIPRVVKIGKKGKDKRLTADERIRWLPPAYSNMVSGFLALKWLGNTGSHGLTPVSPTDLESACIILDDFLQQLFRKETDHSVAIKNLHLTYGPKS